MGGRAGWLLLDPLLLLVLTRRASSFLLSVVSRLSMQQFLQGYALAQLLPGPLFNISAYIGAAYLGIRGAFVGWVALFLPGLLLVISLLPLWHRFRRVPNVKPFLVGVNATGLGLILAVGVSIYLQVSQSVGQAPTRQAAGTSRRG